jgi:hypothetical protein
VDLSGCSCHGYGAQYELYGNAADGYGLAASVEAFAHCNRVSTVCREWRQNRELRLPLLQLTVNVLCAALHTGRQGAAPVTAMPQ